MFEQADANIKPSALFGIGARLAALVGGDAAALAGQRVRRPGRRLVLFFACRACGCTGSGATRLKKFAAQLPDALELVARALRAGHSLAAGMHVVAEEMPAADLPRSSAGSTRSRTSASRSRTPCKGMCDRVPNLDLRFFVTSVAIQRQTGGDLAEILDKIGYVIRERFKILGQVKALTAEGRLSGVVLIALPFGLFLLMLYMKPDYVELLWTDPMGIKMSIGGHHAHADRGATRSRRSWTSRCSSQWSVASGQ